MKGVKGSHSVLEDDLSFVGAKLDAEDSSLPFEQHMKPGNEIGLLIAPYARTAIPFAFLGTA